MNTYVLTQPKQTFHTPTYTQTISLFFPYTDKLTETAPNTDFHTIKQKQYIPSPPKKRKIKESRSSLQWLPKQKTQHNGDTSRTRVTPTQTGIQTPLIEPPCQLHTLTHTMASLAGTKTTQGKCLPTIRSFVSQHCLAENIDKQIPNYKPIDIPSEIRYILTQHLPPIEKSDWTFDRSIQAATHNSNILKSFNYNTEHATQHTKNTVLSYGSEFRSTTTLEPLLRHHQHWPAIKEIITSGASYPLHPISDEDRLSDIEYMLQRGNHKSALEADNKLALDKAFTKEVKHHWAIPILPASIPLIPGASVTPLGVATQWSINETNDRIIKRRPTHDCTFPGPSGLSCNKRVIKEELDECRYGHALTRFITGIHAIRQRHPDKMIWMNKTDMDAAYRRIHANMQAAQTCITVIDDIAYLLGRLPFGSSPAPTKFSNVSDTIGDVAQDISLDKSWDPSTLKSSFDLDFKPIQENDDIPIAHADPLLMSLPERDIVTDNFIDDLFQACLDIDDNAARIKHAIPLVLEAFFREHHSSDASPRDPIINMTKHQAEGRLEESKIILGWTVNTRTFRLSLPKEKATDWIHDITSTLSTGHCTEKLLETMIGRFNHTGFIVTIARYFLTRLRFRLKSHQKKRTRQTRIYMAPWDVKDLKLWKSMILSLSTVGISINNICTVLPSSTVCSDACEWGLGGYSRQGPAWRWLIPLLLQGKASINFLEFLAAIITIMLSITNDTHSTSHPHILAFTDNSSALGWMHHSTFDPVNNPQHDDLARHLASFLIKHEATLFSQHIPGEQNVTADCLSRDFHLSDTAILSLLHTKAPQQQVPHNIHMTKLPPAISSWATSMLESLPPGKGSQPRPKPSSLAHSGGTKPSSNAAASATHSSPTCPPHKDNWSCRDSHTVSGQTTTVTPPETAFSEEQFRPPSRMWFRPSGRTSGLTPHETTREKKGPSSPDN